MLAASFLNSSQQDDVVPSDLAGVKTSKHKENIKENMINPHKNSVVLKGKEKKMKSLSQHFFSHIFHMKPMLLLLSHRFLASNLQHREKYQLMLYSNNTVIG